MFFRTYITLSRIDQCNERIDRVILPIFTIFRWQTFPNFLIIRKSIEINKEVLLRMYNDFIKGAVDCNVVTHAYSPSIYKVYNLCILEKPWFFDQKKYFSHPITFDFDFRLLKTKKDSRNSNSFLTIEDWFWSSDLWVMGPTRFLCATSIVMIVIAKRVFGKSYFYKRAVFCFPN